MAMALACGTESKQLDYADNGTNPNPPMHTRTHVARMLAYAHVRLDECMHVHTKVN